MSRALCGVSFNRDFLSRLILSPPMDDTISWAVSGVFSIVTSLILSLLMAPPTDFPWAHSGVPSIATSYSNDAVTFNGNISSYNTGPLLTSFHFLSQWTPSLQPRTYLARQRSSSRSTPSLHHLFHRVFQRDNLPPSARSLSIDATSSSNARPSPPTECPSINTDHDGAVLEPAPLYVTFLSLTPGSEATVS